jgi:hypothetical protein
MAHPLDFDSVRSLPRRAGKCRETQLVPDPDKFQTGISPNIVLET